MKYSKAYKRLTFVFVILLGVLLWGLVKIDPAASPLRPTTAPEAFDSSHKTRPLVVFLSYADGHPVYFRNQNGMVFSAINKGIDIMHSYRRHHMDAAFYEAHKETLTQKRGAGYWLWKPYFVLKTMEQYPDDAVIIYADSGVVFTKPIDKILDELKTYDRVLVGQGKPVPLRRHLKREAQIALGIDTKEDILNQQNLWNFFFALKNTPENRAYVKKWLALCQQKDLITDLPFDPLKQEKEFEFHQHDQSMMSVIQAQDPGKTIIIPKNVFRNVYGVNNFHRHPEEQYTSPFLLIAGMPMWLSTALFNNIAMTTLRRIMG